MDTWWKNAIIYGIDVERFCDGDDDGVGDFKGLLSKVPYLADLGVTCIWLLPFYPSAGRDNGYDVTDYFGVDAKYGLLDDFITFLHKAGEHSIRVIVDLVTHHTSDQHPWFQAARRNETSRYRNYYLWAAHPPPVRPGKGTIFPGEETSVWTYDEVARAFYHHRFYHFEPGLNPDNPEVRAEIHRVMDFWMSFGISGFRVDAASHMVERPVPGAETPDDPHDILRELYQRAKEVDPSALLLGEVDEPPDKLKAFTDGEQLNMMFNFLLDNYLFLALADERAEPIRRALDMLPPQPPNGQWANFLRNLDEADLERLAPDELDRVFKALAPEESMRIYGRGIRRRLAPMLGGDMRRIKMAFSLLLSLPGAPVFVYGDEIGMGEDLSQPGRNAVRSPMQWSSGKNAGFSDAPAGKLIQPVIQDGAFGYRRVNVAEQQGRPDSLLTHMKRLIHLRRTHDSIGSDGWHPLDSGSEHVLAHQFGSGDDLLIILHNLKGKPARVDLQLDPKAGERLEALLGEGGVPLRDGRLRTELGPYGFLWLGASRGSGG